MELDLNDLQLSDDELRDLDIDIKPKITDFIRPNIINLATIEPEETAFLWFPYIPKGKLTLLEGDPGLGKTFLALNLCSAISNGWPLPGPDGKPSDPINPGNILYMTAEDGLADTLVPRLVKVGADRSRIFCLTGWRTTESEEEQSFTLHDINVLRVSLEQVRPVLVVIDPLQAYIGNIDMHRANETRPVLSNLARIAEEFGCAVMVIRHLSKSGGTKALYRGLGSIDFTAAARSVLLVGQNQTTDQKAMIHSKSTCAEIGKPLGFEINSQTGFIWTGLSDCTAEDLLLSTGIKDNAFEEAKEFLLEALQEEPIKADTLLNDGVKETGVSKRTFHRAKKELGIKSEKRADGWYWYLPINSRLPLNKFGNLGNLDTGLTESGDTTRLPTLPKEKRGNLEQVNFDSWLEVGTEIKPGGF